MVSEYQSFWQGGGQVFAFSVTDRFTDYGTVGVVFIKEDRSCSMS